VLVSATYTPSTFSPFINGSTETTLAGTTLAATGLYVGGPTNYFNGSVSEILIYSSNLSTTQRQQVEGYLAAKWGLLNNLPGKTLSPLNIPGCALWLDVSDPSTVTSGSTVTSITDKSPNKLTTTLSSTLPTYSATQINGTPGISFTGSSWIRGNFTSAYTGSNLIVFAVGSATSTANAYRRLVSFSVPGTYDYVSSSQVIPILLQTTNAVIESFRAGDQASKSISYGTNYLFEAEYTGSSNNFYLNGGSPASVASSGTFNISNWGIGYLADYGNTSDAAYWTGNFGEVVVYFGSLTTLQRQSVENYLMSKWGISNVTTHPFKSIPPSTSQPPQFQEVTPGNWTRDWQPYLQRLAAANNPTNATVIPTLSYGAAAPGGNGGVLGPNNCVYAVSSTNLMIYNIATNTTSSVTLSTAAGQRGGVLAPNGYLYFGGDSNILIVNPSNNSYSYINFTYTGGQTTAGGVLAPNGNIYYSTYYAARSMVVNTSNNTVSSITLPGGQGWIGACLAPNGLIYAVPYGATTSVLVINPNTNTYSNITPSLTPALSTQNYTGCVLGPNGLIYGIPYSASNILIINPATNSVTYGTGGPSLSPALSTQTMYCGVLAPNGNIYGMPIGGASNILIINTFTNAVSWGTGGSSLSPALSTQGYASAVLAPNGNIYGIPGGASNMLIISNTYAQLPSSNCCLSAFLNKY